jgi:short-subunit dehydrogenase
MNICITGASRGLGEELCRVAIASGHKVWGIARRKERMQMLEKSFPPGSFFWSETDVSREDSVTLWKKTMENSGFKPDLVILNASVLVDDLKESGYDHFTGSQMIDVNLSGALRCAGALLPQMLERGKGTFVAVASTAMLRPSVRSAAYSAGKAGIAIAMRSLKQAFGKRGVDFKTVCLGPIATEMWEGKRNRLVPSPGQAAKAILRFSGLRKSVLYYPFLTTTLLRLSLWLPDSVFAKASNALMK